MLNNPSFRRSANCGRFDSMLKGRELQYYPIEKMIAKDLTQSWIDSNGLDKPVLFESAAGLGLKLPPKGTKLSDIAAIIGPDHPIKLIAVGEQSEIPSTLGNYAQYISNRSVDHKVLNLISLEVSATRLSGKVQSPSLVREVDWIDKCWPLDRRARGDFPQVQKYCLCGMGGSYTDFHVDFGGTSVWYHVVSGQKRFYLIPPSTKNLRAYENWTCSKSQDTVFFGDIVGKENCYQLDLFAGQTLLIPGAWIHAVYTPQDSLVFGGNFLNSYNIVRQLQVYGIEQRTFVGKLYCFPYFKLVNWLVLCTLLPIARKIFGSESGKDSNKTEDGSDSDEDSEDLITLCQSIKKSSVFKQFPYLVRTCHFWILAADDEEHASFLKAAQEAWCNDSLDVINSWWELLLILADTLDASVVKDETKENSLRLHVERIRDVKVFDLLDKRVVGAAFGENNDDCEGEGEGEGEGVNDVDSDHTGVKVEINDKYEHINKFDADNKSANFHVDNRNQIDEVIEIPKVAPSLRIKLKLNSLDSDDGKNEAEEDDEEEESSSLKFKFQMPSMLSVNEKSVGDLSSNSMKFNIAIASNSSSSSFQANQLKSRMALQSERMKNNRSTAATASGLVLNTKKIGVRINLPKSSVKRKIRKLEEYEDDFEDRPVPVMNTVNHEFDLSNILPEKEGGGGGRYSTRGNRVSAAFLLHAEDVDIRDVGSDENSDDAAQKGKSTVRCSKTGVNITGGGEELGIGRLNDDEIPFLFDDDAGAPYGEEDWIACKSDDEEDDMEDHKINFRDDDDDESDCGEDDENDEEDEEEYNDSRSKKRSRDASTSSVLVPASIPLKSKAMGDQVRRSVVKHNQTNRQRLMARFK